MQTTSIRESTGRIYLMIWRRLSIPLYCAISFTADANAVDQQPDIFDLLQHNQQQALQLKWMQIALAGCVLLLLLTCFTLWRLYRARKHIAAGNEPLTGMGSIEFSEMSAALVNSEANARYHYNLLQSMLENSSEVSVFALDHEYRYLFFNKRHREGAKRIRNAEIAIGMNMLESISDSEFRDFCRKGFDYVLKGNTLSIESEEKVVRSGISSIEYADNYGSPIFNDRGEVVGLTVFSINTTEHKLSEQKLKRALEFSEGIINTIPDLLFEMDREGRYLNVWAQDSSLLAAQKEMLIGRTVHEVLTPEGAATAMSAIAEADEKGQAHGKMICIELPQGKRWFDHSLAKRADRSAGRQTFLVLSRDVTERVENDQKLKAALEFSEGIINAIPDLLFEMDREGRYLNIWTHTPELLVKSRDELLNRVVSETLDRHSASIVMEALQEADEQELSFGKIFSINLPQGQSWFELSVSKISGEDLPDPHFLVLSRDISRLKQTELALTRHRNELEQRVNERTAALNETNRQLRAEIIQRQRAQEGLTAREREFRTLAEHLPDNLARYDALGRILYYNPALEATLGISTSEVRGLVPVAAHPDWDFQEYQQHLMDTLDTGLSCEFEFHLPDVDTADDIRFHHIIIAAECEADGTVTGALAIGRDVTERRRAERELVLLNRAIDEAFDAVYLLDTSAKIRYANKAAVRTLGYSYEELLSLALFDIDPVMTTQRNLELMDEIIRNDRLTTTIESQHRRKNGECFSVEVGAAVVRYGGEILFLTTVRDISERKAAENLLHEQQEALRAALDNAPDAIIRYDRDLRRIYFNPIMQRVLESIETTHNPLQTTPAEASPIIENKRYADLLRQVLETGEERQAELPFLTKDETRWGDLRFAPEFDAKGKVASVLVFGRDITQRRVLERENALLRAMADNAVDPLIFAHSMDIDSGLPLVYFNPSFARHLGYSEDEMRGLSISDIVPLSKTALVKHIDKLRSKASLRFETELICKNSKLVPVEVTLSYLKRYNEELAAGYCMDISKRRDNERRLHESHIQLQELASHNEIVREEERKHIARELHDDLGQYLTALRLLVSATGIEYGMGEGPLAERIRQMLDLIDSTKLSVRNLSQQLRPAVLDMGVYPALDWLVREFRSRGEIDCELSIEDPEIIMDDRNATVVFRVVQESLTNVLRHSLASTVVVLLMRQGDFFLLEICDDGKGFDPCKKRAQSFGLAGMRERLIGIGGKLEVVSKINKGTRVIAHVPVHEVNNEVN